MRLLSAELSDFRNIQSAHLDFSPRFTALVGANGQGKTNALEALYLLTALRPLRNVNRRVLLKQGTSKAKISVRVERDTTGLVHDLGVELTPSKRVLSKDDKTVDASQFIGCAVAVCFTPDDLQLAKAGPDLRRRFLDRALLNVRPSYLTSALRYQKAVRDRNKVLADVGNDELLDAFDAIIAKEGAVIMLERARFVAQLQPRVQEGFELIASPAPRFEMRYACRLDTLNVEDLEQTQSAFYDKLQRRRTMDRARRTTSVGPHLDDLDLRLGGEPVKERASQGQHRALVLALKLAEITHLAERLGEAPLLFLDDMSSELDATRTGQLFEAVRALDGQVILTGTQTPTGLTARDSSELAIYNVKEGRLTPADSGMQSA